jgi:hypothetical protein
VPNDITNLLHTYSYGESREQADRWREEVIEILVERAASSAFDDRDRGGQRAPCPLCHGGSTTTEGFALPEGLRRHLEGSAKARRCIVMDAVSGLLEEYLAERLASIGEAERKALAERRQTETLYRVSPDGEPLLEDEGPTPGRSRSPGELGWAEDRLRSLGFRCVVDGRTRSWVDETDRYVVYADLRSAGEIGFEVWPKPLPARPTIGLRLRRPPGRFHLKDSWMHDLPGKYAQRVAKALAGER